MKKILVLFFIVVAQSWGQAPDSIEGFVYRDHTGSGTSLSGTPQFFTSLEFHSDGSYITRLNFSFNLQSGGASGSTVGGTFRYSKAAVDSGIIVLTPISGATDTLTLYFGSTTSGSVVRGSGPEGYFSLLPTIGDATKKALVNVSTLCYAKRGVATTVGFVVGGSQQLREVLIRAIGPTLSSFGIANQSADPSYLLSKVDGDFSPILGSVFTLHSIIYGAVRYQNFLPGELLLSNGWSVNSNVSSTIAAENIRAGAFALTSGSNDKADMVLLDPGAYTITVDPQSQSAEGDELIEVYEVQ